MLEQPDGAVARRSQSECDQDVLWLETTTAHADCLPKRVEHLLRTTGERELAATTGWRRVDKQFDRDSGCRQGCLVHCCPGFAGRVDRGSNEIGSWRCRGDDTDQEVLCLDGWVPTPLGFLDGWPLSIWVDSLEEFHDVVLDGLDSPCLQSNICSITKTL